MRFVKWYQFIHHVCPVCGKERKHQYTMWNCPKPKEHIKRHIYVDVYDGCQGY